ncbi:hypothetical protein A2Y83_03285 [Candidatus Falkowbacteria bacterium RBG_13_39_14]|uniref:Methyltransferase type 11 domain-containing protein n=1 Tax=Candidatus Falkowbacteria bacterium RBG_13_39_14 TaxID=1797985 RepID=A0A1F5S4Y7_9BACT|nr:MAG: hypothetical protein A2Y83_03285 [Candidatus Falkowbacteria bacterium RBG_13_39_14]
MTRSQLINIIIQHYGYKTYLEIGVNTPAQPGWNFDNIKIETKHGVDPSEKVKATFKTTSDEFFDKHISMKYDIIFIDGLHLFEQVYRDIINSLKWLNDNGAIVVHDCNPLLEKTQRRIHTSGAWHGDVWKAILKLRMREAAISIYTVDTDEGCAIIQKGVQKLFEVKDSNVDIYNFTFFDANRKKILNLIDVNQFKKIMNVKNKSNKIIKAKYGKIILGLKTLCRIIKNALFLRTKKNIKLNLGSGGTRMKDYINVDVLFVRETDLLAKLKHLPYFVRKETVSHIYASHILEHFSISEVKKILNICYNLLRKDGEMRISAPDFDKITKIYNNRWEYFQNKIPQSWLGVVYGGQNSKYDFHKTGFNYNWLKYLLEEAGFKDIKEYNADEFLEQYNIKDSSLYKKDFGEYISLNICARKK